MIVSVVYAVLLDFQFFVTRETPFLLVSATDSRRYIVIMVTLILNWLAALLFKTKDDEQFFFLPFLPVYPLE